MGRIGETCAMSGFSKSGAHQHLPVSSLEPQPKDVRPRRNPDGRCEDMHETRVRQSRYGSHALQREPSVTVELFSYELQDLASARMQARRLATRLQTSEPGFDSRRIQRDGISQLPAPHGNRCVLDGRDVLRNVPEQGPSKLALRIH